MTEVPAREFCELLPWWDQGTLPYRVTLSCTHFALVSSETHFERGSLGNRIECEVCDRGGALRTVVAVADTRLEDAAMDEAGWKFEQRIEPLR